MINLKRQLELAPSKCLDGSYYFKKTLIPIIHAADISLTDLHEPMLMFARQDSDANVFRYTTIQNCAVNTAARFR